MSVLLLYRVVELKRIIDTLKMTLEEVLPEEEQKPIKFGSQSQLVEIYLTPKQYADLREPPLLSILKVSLHQEYP